MNYLISCLEPSANLHFSEVLREILALDKNAKIYGIFGEEFSAHGEPLYKSSEFSAMGFVEIIPLIFKAKRALKQMCELAKNCDVVLLIDSPAFNLPLAKALKKSGASARIVYYILPQIWAWKRGRVKALQENCDFLCGIWQFERQFYSKILDLNFENLPNLSDKSGFCFVGHPLLDEIKERKSSYEKNGLITFMPGSRRAEISRLMPVYRELAKKLKSENANLKFSLVVPPFLADKVEQIYGDTRGFSIETDAIKTLAKSEFAFICSGTATLQAALIGTPFVLCYKAKALDVAIARRFVKLKHVGLANIIFDFCEKDELHKELIQEEVSVSNLYDAYALRDDERFARACVELREYLAMPSAKNVARILTTNAKFKV
ncbi:lipid-A-disaccharide synthase [Campylobacter sp. JMF_02 ED1]|uniref:lipid-A-disaccharide synthase n=1 Tax=unclassified Campylobacter TaxID=2593542 RepID=UPI0022E9D73B|nr:MULTISPECIES: lipid-A-disaccharide synthase [unclassified Campylobacter]MDA3049654.1 lipid-A-disaccharide synthase [Campylobacter sp. JMF_15 NE4]MDA3050612.1 lipid-A-disaccharide synthase [Campylobacter sp. JMF_02 ED1]